MISNQHSIPIRRFPLFMGIIIFAFYFSSLCVWAETSVKIDLGNLISSDAGYELTVDGDCKQVLLKGSASYQILGTGNEENCQLILAENGGNVTITLEDVELNFQNVSNPEARDFILHKGNHITMNLVGNHTLQHGIHVDQQSTLEISGTQDSQLTCIARNGSAAIGGTLPGNFPGGAADVANSGTIIIHSGIISASSQGDGASIGSAVNGQCGSILIHGGIISSGGDSTGYGAGIGCGVQGSVVGTITIDGGTVSAFGGGDFTFFKPEKKELGFGAAGIGAGMNGNAGKVKIFGEDTRVYAEASGTAYDIGSNNISGGALHVSGGALIELGKNGTNAQIFLTDGSLSLVDGEIDDQTFRLTGQYKNGRKQEMITLSSDKYSLYADEQAQLTGSFTGLIRYMDENDVEVPLLPQGRMTLHLNDNQVSSGLPTAQTANFPLPWQPQSIGQAQLEARYEANTALDYYEVPSEDTDTITIQVLQRGEPIIPEPPSPTVPTDPVPHNRPSSGRSGSSGKTPQRATRKILSLPKSNRQKPHPIPSRLKLQAGSKKQFLVSLGYGAYAAKSVEVRSLTPKIASVQYTVVEKEGDPVLVTAHKAGTAIISLSWNSVNGNGRQTLQMLIYVLPKPSPKDETQKIWNFSKG